MGSEQAHPRGPVHSLPVGRPQPKGTSLKAKVKASLAKSKGGTRAITVESCPKGHRCKALPQGHRSRAQNEGHL